MNKMVGITFFVIMLIMSVLAGGVYVAVSAYMDPVLNDFAGTIAGLQPEVQARLNSPLAELERIREMARLHLPSILFLAGLIMTLILSPLVRRFARAAKVSDVGARKKEAGISPAKRPPSRPDPRPLLETGACRIMAILQNKGRMIDFLEEDIAGYADDQIGAAVRQIHEDCRNALHEYMTLSPVMTEPEGETVEVAEGFDPSEIRLTGQVTGKPPFKGTLQHPGWKVTRMNLPDQPKGQKHTVIAPAEVEVGFVA